MKTVDASLYLRESDFKVAVIRLAQMCGWKVYSIPDSRWLQPRKRNSLDELSGAGFPDLVLAKMVEVNGITLCHVMFRELKTDQGRLTPDQERWHSLLRSAAMDVGVWRPGDWDKIVATLEGTKE